jgi:hypothetical protein
MLDYFGGNLSFKKSAQDRGKICTGHRACKQENTTIFRLNKKEHFLPKQKEMDHFFASQMTN